MRAHLRKVLTGVLFALASAGSLHAQTAGWGDRAQQREQVCARLEGQLAALDRGGGDARSEQARRLEEAAARQQADLDRMVDQSRRMGCERTGFFLFGGGAPPQCDQLRSQITGMRANLDRMMNALEEARGGGGDRNEQRQSILIALGQNGCGPQYAVPQRPRGVFDTLFGSAPQPAPGALPGEVPSSSTFRTVCVRKCDGSFFPISYATNPARFADDERACRRACPATEVELYTYRNPGEEITQATSISGRPYTELPNAFRYRQEYNSACSCKRQGESWAAAVREDPTVERGDIVVTDEKARTMSQPRPAAPARQPRAGSAQRAAPPSSPGTEQPAAELRRSTRPSADPRAVGPQFLPPR